MILGWQPAGFSPGTVFLPALQVAWSTASCPLSNTRPQIRATRKGSRCGNSHAGHFQKGLWEDTSVGKQGREGGLCCSPNRDFRGSREMLWGWNGPLESSLAEAQRQVFRVSVNQSLARIALRRGMTLGEVASMLGEQLLGGTCPLGSAATSRGWWDGECASWKRTPGVDTPVSVA